MAKVWLPGDSDFAKALRGWPSSPNVKPVGMLAVDWSNPLTRGLVGAFVFSDATLRNLVNGEAVSSVGGALVGSYQGKDRVWEFDRTSTSYVDTGIPGDSLSAFTFVSRHYIAAPLAAMTCWLGNRATGGSPGISVYSSYANIKAGVFGAAEYNFSGEDTIWYDKWYTTGASWTGSGGDILLYQEGELISTVDVTAGGMASSNIQIGRLKDTDTGTLDDGQDVYFIWGRVLSAREHREVYRNPFSLLKPANQTPFLVSVPAVGGAPTLSSPGVINILTDRATPQVTLTF